MLSMEDRAWTAAARLEPGQKVMLRVRPYEQVKGKYERLNRSMLADPELQTRDAYLGEVVAEPKRTGGQ